MNNNSYVILYFQKIFFFLFAHVETIIYLFQESKPNQIDLSDSMADKNNRCLNYIAIL